MADKNDRWGGWLCAAGAVAGVILGVVAISADGAQLGIALFVLAALIGLEAGDQLFWHGSTPALTKTVARSASVLLIPVGLFMLIAFIVSLTE